MSKCFFCAKKKEKQETNQINCLGSAKVGKSVCVSGYLGLIDESSKRRLLVLGLVKRAIVKVQNVSLFGDVLLVEVNGYMFSIRKNIANNIMCSEVL